MAAEAQAQARLDDFEGYFAMDRHGDSAKTLFRSRLRAVQGDRRFEGFSLTPLAVGIAVEGTTAIVRAEVSFSVSLNGATTPFRHGILALLVLDKEQRWKILTLAPDDIHDLALFEETSAAVAAQGKRAVPAAGISSYRELDARISSAMKETHISEKTVLDAAMAGIGQAGPIGDTIAITYGVIDVACDTWDLVKESWTYGSSGLLPLRLRKVALGILQVAAEPVPFLDAQADAVAWVDDQLIYNAEMLRALSEFRMQIQNASRGEASLNPRLWLLQDLSEWRYPAGLQQTPEEGATHSNGVPLGGIDLTAPDVYGQRVPFRVAGEVGLAADSPAAYYAIRFGGQRRGDMFYVPVDATHLVEESKEEGDMILEGFAKYRKKGTSFRFVSWDATCRRGIEKISVSLRNGESTPPVWIVNRLMNGVSELRVRSIWPETQMSMQPGEFRGYYRVFGWGKDMPDDRFMPDLTGAGACFNTRITDESVVSLGMSGDGYSLTAIKNGATRWEFLLGGSTAPGAGEVPLSIPIQVGPKQLDELQTMRLVQLAVRGDFTYTTQTGTKKVESVAYGNYYNAATEFNQSVANVPLKWTGARFVAEGQMNGGNLKFKVEGEVNASGTELLWASIKWDYSASWEQHFVLRIQGAKAVPYRAGTKFTYELKGVEVPPLIAEFNETYKSGNLISNYKSVDWTSSTIPPAIQIQFRK